MKPTRARGPISGKSVRLHQRTSGQCPYRLKTACTARKKKENSGFSSSFPKRMSPSFPRHKMTRKRKKKATQRMYTQLNELNIYSFTILKIVSVRSGKKIQLMMTIPMNKILGRTILACKLFFGNFTNKPPFNIIDQEESINNIRY